MSVPVHGGNPDRITPSFYHNLHSPGLVAREVQVTFLALPLFLTQISYCRSMVGAKVAWGVGDLELLVITSL